MKKIKLSVTDFAQPVILTGSIRREGMMTAMELGAKIHKSLQAAMIKKFDYVAEVALKYEFTTKRFAFEASGRADGVIYGEQGHLVEEIKSSLSLERLREEIEQDPQHPYKLQTLTYAYILGEQTGRPVSARLRLVSIRNKKEHHIHLEVDDAYREWLQARLQQLENEERLRIAQRRKRRGIAKTATFPFSPPRPHQNDLAEFVASVAKKGGFSLIQAPTGIGKTVGVLFPVLRTAFSRGNQVFYLTPKNSQFEVAAEAIKKIVPGRSVKSRLLTAKRKLCRKEFIDCNPDYCEFARNYYDKMQAHDVANQVKRLDCAGPNDFIRIAESCEVCPYQVQMDTLNSADLIVGDYNYVFSPNAGLSHLFTDIEKPRRPTLIIDEVHNLYSRGMEYYSPSLDVFFFEEVKGSKDSEFQPPQKLRRKFNRILNECKALILSSRPETGQSSKVVLNGDHYLLLKDKIHSLLLDYISETDRMTDHDPILGLYRAWSSFCDVLAVRADETQSAYVFSGGREFIQLICCDPSRFLSETMMKFFSVTGFSATIKPFNFYQRLSGFPEDTATREFPSGFPDENRKVLIIPQVSTTWRERNKNYGKIAEAVARISKECPGNYLVFLPSYDFLGKTYDAMTSIGLSVQVQSRETKADEFRDIERLLTSADTQNIILAVQGGILSEGVDFNSPHFKGVFVVGPAVPLVSFEREILREYFEKKFGDGFSYAYAWPAMTRSIQASGRVIRDVKKRGIIILMDGRFLQDPYQQSLPEFWYKSSPRELVSSSILTEVRNFWNESHQSTQY